jgi:hypothetical protein
LNQEKRSISAPLRAKNEAFPFWAKSVVAQKGNMGGSDAKKFKNRVRTKVVEKESLNPAVQSVFQSVPWLLRKTQNTRPNPAINQCFKIDGTSHSR